MVTKFFSDKLCLHLSRGLNFVFFLPLFCYKPMTTIFGPFSNNFFLGRRAVFTWSLCLGIAQPCAHELENSLNRDFHFGNGYFDSDCGQKWFWDGILMEIMVDIGEIWWNLGASVIFYIHWRTAKNHLGKFLRNKLASSVDATVISKI